MLRLLGKIIYQKYWKDLFGSIDARTIFSKRLIKLRTSSTKRVI